VSRELYAREVLRVSGGDPSTSTFNTSAIGCGVSGSAFVVVALGARINSDAEQTLMFYGQAIAKISCCLSQTSVILEGIPEFVTVLGYLVIVRRLATGF
jgi:hypothetical protein